MKKIVAGILVLTMSMSALAQTRDVVIKFTDGSQHTYNQTPYTVTPEQVKYRVDRDFPFKTVSDIELQNINGQGAMPEQVEQEATDWKKIALTVFGVALIAAAIYFGVDAIRHAGAAKAHPCSNPGDYAKDGSRCGLRSSASRPGGLP